MNFFKKVINKLFKRARVDEEREIKIVRHIEDPKKSNKDVPRWKSTWLKLTNITRLGRVSINTALVLLGSLIGVDIVSAWDVTDDSLALIIGKAVLTVISLVMAAKGGNSRLEDGF